MSAPRAIPPPLSSETIAGLLSGLLLKTVAVKRSVMAINLATPTPTFAASYVQNDGTVAAICVYDLYAAAHLATALALVPVGVAQDAIRARALSPNLMENFREVLNISSQLYLGEDEHTTRVSLGAIHVLPGNLPERIRSIIFHPTSRLDLDISIPSYGTGRMALRWP